MTAPDAVFRERSAEPRVSSVPLSHLSIELGHLYVEDFAAGPDRLVTHFRQVAPWAETARQVGAAAVPGRRARISTCFLIDDYFTPFSSPAEVVPALVAAARDNGLVIDYLVREAGCAVADGVPLAGLLEARLVPDPPRGTTGLRPPTTETGWLSNGRRSSDRAGPAAMAGPRVWMPPAQNAATRHSIFVDVQLWDGTGAERTWSCWHLATVWQLLRLGLLRDRGAAVAVPRNWEGEYPDDWDELPSVLRLNPAAPPFSAYRTLSVLDGRFLPVEHAVRTILGQVLVEAAVLAQTIDRARDEGLELPTEISDRIAYVFAG